MTDQLIVPTVLNVEVTPLDFALSTGQFPHCPPEIIYRQSGVLFKEYHFPVPALEWPVTHNMGTTRYLEKIMDAQGRRLIVGLDDETANGFVIRFSEPEAGKVILMFEAPEQPVQV